jgi:AcrR family transcriptional regulator
MLTAAEIDARRRDARRREIVERILPAVEELLTTARGYRNVSVEQILHSSGLSRSTFYRYFKDKSELLLALSEPALETIMKAAMRPWELGPGMTRGQLEAELRRTIDAYRPHIALLNAMTEASAYDERVSEQFLSGYTAVRRAIADHLREGQREGFVRADVHPDETAGWLTWMAERGMSQLVPSVDDAGLRLLAESMAAIVWHAVYEPLPEGPSDGDRSAEPVSAARRVAAAPSR